MAESKKLKAKELEARRRAEYILKARSGLMSVDEAASGLGVSRKTYYRWEQKAFDSMLEALIEKEPGRPALSPEAEEARQLREQLKKRDEKIAQFEKRTNLIKEACKLKIKMAEGLAEKKYGNGNFT